MVDINKFDVLWTEHKANTNTLYLLKDESLYNSCKKWFMLVQDENNQTLYLAYHNTFKNKASIITNIRTSKVSPKKQLLYKVDNLDLNNKSRMDYDTVFNNKILYTIPDQHIDVIGKIDANLIKYVEKFKISQTQHWLTSAKPSVYDHKGAFDKFGFIDWTQQCKFNVNDIVFIYVAAKDKKIRYKTIVEKINIPFDEINDDKEFWKKYKKDKNKKYARLKLLKEIDDNELSYENLKKLGYLITQGCKRIDKDFANYLNIHFGEEILSDESSQKNIPLNQILYGPPGTGKTYSTIIEAMKILNPACIEYDNDNGNVSNYSVIKENFDKAKSCHQIEFVTFHQSYSYEEFVEGIKPQISEWGLIEGDDVKYTGKDGIFKIICKNARQIRTDKTSSKIDFTKARIFKMSLGAIGDGEDIYNYCLNNNVVALGWGNDKDFSKCIVTSDFKAIDDTWGAKAVEIFKNWMRIGDIILISNGNSNIKAIAQITGNYEYHNDTEIKYCQFREVKWLYNGEDIPVSKFYDKKLSQQAIYAFYSSKKEGKADYNSTINTNVLNEIITGNINSIEEQPYVLIIDEINRGNISKIFGELITLIEEDKRENLSVQLPYSQETFTVPKNLYIIGTMNTSDRSIASIDIALRRRFTFKEMMPNVDLIPNIDVFGIGLHSLFTTLNQRISVLLDRDHQIGHSYFMKLKNEINANIEFKHIWFDCVMPLLNEYFYGDWEKLRALLGEAQADGKSFIKKIDKIKFANNYSCDDDETYDFVSENDIDFEAALNNAFKDI